MYEDLEYQIKNSKKYYNFNKDTYLPGQIEQENILKSTKGVSTIIQKF